MMGAHLMMALLLLKRLGTRRNCSIQLVRAAICAVNYETNRDQDRDENMKEYKPFTDFILTRKALGDFKCNLLIWCFSELHAATIRHTLLLVRSA